MQYMILQCTGLCTFVLHFSTLDWCAGHYIQLQYSRLHCSTVHYIAIHCITVQYTILYPTTLQFSVLNSRSLHCNAQNYILALDIIAEDVEWIPHLYTALHLDHCIALHTAHSTVQVTHSLSSCKVHTEIHSKDQDKQRNHTDRTAAVPASGGKLASSTACS